MSMTTRLQVLFLTCAVSASCGGLLPGFKAPAPAPPTPPPAPPAAPPLTIAAPANAEAKVKRVMEIAASADVNPDGSGRPSPVVVRVYQLRTDGGFNATDFFALFDDDQKVLGQELISRDEFVLGPTERRMLDVTFSGETRFLGVIAAFRDIRNSEWRAVLPTPSSGVAVSVERARIVMAQKK